MKRHTLIITLLLTGVFLCSFSILYYGLTKMQEARYAQEETEDNPKWTEEQEREEHQSAAPMTQTAPPEETKTPTEEETETPAAEETEKQPVRVDEVRTQRLSPQCIQVCWNSDFDANVEEYIVKRRPFSNGEPAGDWEALTVVKSGAGEYIAEDHLPSAVPVQYEYRVDVKTADDHMYEPKEGKAVLASNVMVCIDPGHFAGKNAAYSIDSFGYAEGDFTLEIALCLRDILKETYGIDSYMTRESGSIILDGYRDQELDSGHISLRGMYAASRQSNLFVSIHTNANNDQANGYDTWEQPTAINKTLVFLNQTAMESAEALKTANAIGVNLSRASYELGLSTVGEFRTVTEPSQLRQWTDGYNDSLNEMGTVVYRLNDGQDYYGVLRGAASEGIPGMIIEHGLHTIPEVRKTAGEGLAQVWARADAYGIAYGFGFMKDLTMEEEYENEQ